jgi:hypothetical protein
MHEDEGNLIKNVGGRLYARRLFGNLNVVWKIILKVIVGNSLSRYRLGYSTYNFECVIISVT